MRKTLQLIDKVAPTGARRHVQEILQQSGGNKVRAARALGISRRALYRLITKYHLEPGRPKDEG